MTLINIAYEIQRIIHLYYNTIGGKIVHQTAKRRGSDETNRVVKKSTQGRSIVVIFIVDHVAVNSV